MVDIEEEFVLEPSYAKASEDGDDEDTCATQVQKLREKLKKAVEEKQEYLEGWQRARADFANFKKEEASMHVDREARITANLAEAIIPTLDSFEMALGSASFRAADPQWQKGISALYQGLVGSLAQVGIEQFSPRGEVFNPYKHEALREVATDDASLEHTIETVERSGYSIGERIIRPAQVSVYARKAE